MLKTKGKWIVAEGLEGAGKSTALTLLQADLQAHGIQVLVTREPGGTPLAENIRHLLTTAKFDEVIDVYTELFLLYAARRQLLTQVILPALTKGIWVLCDRFELSTFAYQGGGRGIGFDEIKRVSMLCLQGVTPDWTFFLDIDPIQGLERVRQRSNLCDRFEKESLEFFQRVYRAYHHIIQHIKNIEVLDALSPTAVIQQKMRARLMCNFGVNYSAG